MRFLKATQTRFSQRTLIQTQFTTGSTLTFTRVKKVFYHYKTWLINFSTTIKSLTKSLCIIGERLQHLQFQKIQQAVFIFFETPVLRFALLPYYHQNHYFIIASYCLRAQLESPPPLLRGEGVGVRTFRKLSHLGGDEFFCQKGGINL